MCFVSCGGNFPVTLRKPGPPQAKQWDFLRGISLPVSVSHKCWPSGSAVDQQLVEEIRIMNCGVAEEDGEGADGCEGM